ncbi:MAG: S41 family peptidase, partial [Ignavibacteriaceae bacterium]
IIDSRYNTGGSSNEYLEGMSILFNEDQDIFQNYVRNKADDHYSMIQHSTLPDDHTQINATRYLFDRPIAVLIGPFSFSCGDLMPLQMRYHPMVKTFGLGTNGAYGENEIIDISNIVMLQGKRYFL